MPPGEDDDRDPSASDSGATDPGARRPKRGTSAIIERADAYVPEDGVPVRELTDSKSGATIADTPRTRGHANLAALPTRFNVKSTLGEGGMGTVVEAYDRALGRDVAIKVLAKESAGDQSVGARFIREARAAAQLRHPGIVQVHDIDPDGQYIVMELVKGESLAARLRRERTLPASEVRRIGGLLLEALGVAHAAGIVHRDVKPANVLLGEKGEVKLSDFGVAFFGDSSLTMPGTRIGTPAYMAPEQLRARHVDARADVYAAGATLFEAATGKRLHDDDVVPKDLTTVVVDATGDATLAKAIARAVRERPSDRFEDGTAFARALDGPTITEAGVALPKPVPRRMLVTGLVGLALVGGTVAYVARGGDRRPVAGDAGAAIVDARIGPRVIALLPFADTTKNPLLDFASSGLPNLLGLELHEVPGVTVLGYYQLLGHLKGPDEPVSRWREAAAKLDASVVVHGELSTNGDRIHVVIRIETPTGGAIDAIERDAKIEEVPEVVRSAAGQVAQAALGKRFAAIAPSAVLTSFDAQRELQLGIAELEREHLAEAITHLRAAVHHARDLKLAHYYLAVALYWSAPPAGPAREEIDRALALGLDEVQRGFLDGVRHIVEQDFKAGIDQLLPLSEKYPADKDVLYALFEALFHGGRPAEAMAVYHRLITLQPRFRLALVHAFTFYVAHADESGTSWALALGDPAGDTYNRIWEPRVMIAHRDYKAAIRLLSQSTDASSPELQGELITAYLLDDQLELASVLIGKLGKDNAKAPAMAQLSLASIRGDAAARLRWRSIHLRDVATQVAGAGRTINLTLIAVSEIPVATKTELAEISRVLDESIVADYDRSLNLNIAQAVLADALGDTPRVTRFSKSPYPEVSELAVASLARKTDRAAAAAAVRRAIAASGDARFLIYEWYLLAGDLHASGDHAGTIAACDQVIHPRLFNWAWGTTVMPCLQWTAEAQEALGNKVLARAAWSRIVGMRNQAPASDLLLRAAKAGIARLR